MRPKGVLDSLAFVSLGDDDKTAGRNCVHYNLPKKQQNALQEYIGVSAYPTYKLVTPNGVLLPTDVPHPNHPKGIRNMIEKLKNKNN